MKRLLPLPILLVFLLPSASEAWQKKDPTPPVIVFPVDPKPAPPKPPPSPDPCAPIQLAPNMTYVIESDTELIIGDSPAGLVKIVKEKGPIKIRSVFPCCADGKAQTMTFDKAYVSLIEPLTKGNCELLIIPVGATDITRKMIQVLDGPIPRPVPITISINPATATVPVGGKQQFTATASQGGVTWTASGAGSVDTTGLFTATAKSGSASVVATSALDPSKRAEATVAVTDIPPPNPAPIPTPGFRVLMVYSVKDEETYPPAQQAILYDKSIRDYLASKCVKGSDGTPERRIWDAGVDASAESKLWQDALKRDKKTLPWIIISDGKTGFEGPLPSNVTDTLTLLKKYGGA